jgi:CubicO group peptidase (beta-lactamase class C family)
VESLALIESWPVGVAAAGVIATRGARELHGRESSTLAWASVTKLATSLAVLIAAEEQTLPLEEIITEAGATVADVLSHSSGLAPERPQRQLAPPRTRRIYSNAGYELVGDEIAIRAGMKFEEYLGAAVLAPLGMDSTQLRGSPAWGMSGPLSDLVRLAGELLEPTLVAAETHAAAIATVGEGLDGTLPGFGKQSPCDWGLGPEIRDGKTPHWTAPDGSPRTYGHFGRSGCFVWVDPDEQLACAALTDTEFGPWAVHAWPEFSSAVLAEWQAEGRELRFAE